MAFQWLPFLTYAVITAITPGPNNIMAMSNGNRRGFKKAMPFNFGMWAGFVIVLTLCTLFCGALSALIPKIKTPMMLLGAGYILWLARETFRADGVIEEHGGRDGFFKGLLLQFVNPKFHLYCIMSLEAYILPGYGNDLPMIVLLNGILILICMICNLLWTVFGAAFRKLFRTHAKAVNTVLALLLVYCAAALFFS